jgi:hypothetical protein
MAKNSASKRIQSPATEKKAKTRNNTALAAFFAKIIISELATRKNEKV